MGPHFPRSCLSPGSDATYVDAVASGSGRFRERKDMDMGFDDALNKAKDFAGDNPDKAEQVLDTAGDKIKERTPDNVDGKVDSGMDAARDQLGLGGDDKDKKGK